MPVSTLMSTKTLRETVAGELVCFPSDDGRHGWAIVTHVSEGHVHFALLKSDVSSWPDTSFTNLDETTSCIGYGTDWVFEPLLAGCPASTDLITRRGSWVVQGSETGIRLANPARSPRDAVVLNLATLERIAVNLSHAVGGQHWRLWASQAEKDDPQCGPLLEHPFVAPE